ncbi:bacteriohemerythrin [Caenispirillum salinarum]|nr:bacteriohemerythrin [Caenispirillum salinarum]
MVQSLLTWTDKMSVGVETLDADHKKLMGFVNELHAAVKTRAGAETVGRILDELIAYTEYHFEVEEQLQKLARFPDRAAHREKHEALKAKVYQLRDTFRADPESLNNVKVFDFLSDWLVRHILGDDMKYAPYLAKAANRAPPA